MRDGDIRAALHRRIRDEHPDKSATRIVDEMSLCGSVRVDVSVINGALTGYELKSQHDDLRRLPTQAEYYSRVLDHAVLVVTEHHLEAATEILPAWWGILVAQDGEHVTVQEQRSTGANPQVDGHSLVTLLWRDEALDALEARNMATGLRSKPRARLWATLADGLPLDELRAVVRDALKSREGWRDPQ